MASGYSGPEQPSVGPGADVSLSPRSVFAIFQGGGAKGIAHVGALKALEENGLEPIGVAGTSAGALVAVLAAIGLEADDILQPTDRAATILNRFGKTPVGVLGDRDWHAFQRLTKKWRWAALKAAVFGPLVNSALSPRVTKLVLRTFCTLGHFSTTHIRSFVNEVIKDRLATIAAEAELGRSIPDDVTFTELASGWPTVIPLKIVATDVDQGTLEIFDAERTPDVVVAEAVAASIAIPIVFRPAHIPSYRPGRFADGGLVSNLPIWVFAEEKLAYEREHPTSTPVPVIGFSLREANAQAGDAGAEDASFGAYLKKVIYASLQGSQGTAAKFLDDVLIVPLDTSIGLLAFAEDWEQYCGAYESGRVCADRHLNFSLGVKPQRIRRELQTVQTKVANHVAPAAAAAGKVPLKPLRIALIRPFGSKSLRVMESLYSPTDADDRLLLDRRGGVYAQTFRHRGLGIFKVGRGRRGFMSKYEQALLRRSVKTVMCVPIFRESSCWQLPEPQRPEPAGILAIDSDQDLAAEFNDPNLFTMLVMQSAVLYEAVSSEVDHA